jgi:hypothetical protein
MRKFIDLALAAALGLVASVHALADSKSVGEFLLKTCFPAMDDLSNVEAMAREGNWTPKPLPSFITDNRFRKSHSRWDVAQSDDRFSVNVWINHLGQQDYNICFVNFLSNDVDRSENVDREELLTFIAASVQLTLISDTKFAQTNMRSETYEIKNDRITSDRAKPVRLLITSQSDAKVDMVGIVENFRFPPVPAPATPSGPGK